MSRLTAKRLPQTPTITATIAQIEPDVDSLTWRVPARGRAKSFVVDLTPFAIGVPETGIPAKPLLIRQLAVEFRRSSMTKAEATVAVDLNKLRLFWRFLGMLEIHGPPLRDDLSSITPTTGAMLKNYVINELRYSVDTARKAIKTIQALVEATRQRLNLVPHVLVWPTVQLGRGTIHRDVDPQALRHLYNEAKSVVRRCSLAYQEGQELLTTGIDPRVQVNGRFRTSPAWYEPANVAWLTKHCLDHMLSSRSVNLRELASDFYVKPDRTALILPRGYEQGTLFDRFRWFAPQLDEIAAAVTLVLLHTGWNIDTVFNIDISSMEQWCQERLTSDAGQTVAIYGNKGRTHREQVAFCLMRPEFHPYKVIKNLIDRTEILRNSLRMRLADIKENVQSADRQDRVVELERAISTPWLFLRGSMNDETFGRVGVLNPRTMSGSFRESFQAMLRTAGIDEKLTPSDLRDGFASFVYDNSLFNILLVKRALGHQNLSATKHYLRQRRMLSQRFADYTAWSDGLFEDVRRFQAVDPTILYIRARFGDVTEDQRRRLSDYRLRTRMGMGCLDPENPPRTVAPAHQGGNCSVQRCTLCRHGVVFEESFEPLAHRVAELQVIRGHTPLDRWEASSFQAEWIAIEATVARVFQQRAEEFEAAVEAHVNRLRDGTCFLFDEIGAGDLRLGALN
ncbi:tyrosine-type recombinase/integrase [Burkholderia contaminans]|uniref:tyrosine-type recombinase/integrase n=1 Tax=Burkholderia contaminans TaxID=488447 RepID=UPI002417DA5C|nr:tyrosine-type recombinase/integrase [Burkholderia contaminans]WFN10115.1 tyrosine-type recombinase/integrase [Burkholderia contaminans]